MVTVAEVVEPNVEGASEREANGNIGEAFVESSEQPDSPPADHVLTVQAASPRRPATATAGSQDLALLQDRIATLEAETAEPQRQAAAKARKKALREVQKVLDDTNKPAEVKLHFLHDKFTRQLAEQARLENELFPLRRRCKQAVKEKDDAHAEAARALQLNETLSELCRQLQKENRRVLDTAQATADQEHAKRKELSDRFEETVKDITARMDEQAEERRKTVKENDALKTRLKAFLEQYELREEHFQGQLKSKDLELQLADAKLRQQTELANQSERKAELYAEQARSFQAEDSRAQKIVDQYGAKFAEFQEQVSKSNQLFGKLQTDMKKKNEELRAADKDRRFREKQVKELTATAHRANLTITQLKEELAALKAKGNNQQGRERTNSVGDVDVAKLQAQKAALEQLARALQQEVKQLKSAAQASTAAEPAAVEASVD
ncbi:hypothetical protein WJX72_006120 [[Myrmecia] bisecta]|uniref:Alpha-taxilin n=1 Tax=[Myrmecia] bisecta TaxID=41462 RepID=A0AAW1PK60_9CHLO